MSKELTANRFNREVRGKSTIDDERKSLLTACERWLQDVAQALGYDGHRKDGFEIKSTRWDDDGTVTVLAFDLNADGKRYVVGEGAERTVATKRHVCPVSPPDGLSDLAE